MTSILFFSPLISSSCTNFRKLPTTYGQKSFIRNENFRNLTRVDSSPRNVSVMAQRQIDDSSTWISKSKLNAQDSSTNSFMHLFKNICSGICISISLVLLSPDPDIIQSAGLKGYIPLNVIEAEAAGLLRMPPENLNNTYWLVRAGESEWESSGVIHTNPVAKTNVESGLSTVGKQQSIKSAYQLKNAGACVNSCWIWPSITQNAYQTAEIISYVNGMNYSRIVPEYSFLDQRGLGSFEGKDLKFLQQIYELDAESPNLRPPKFTDGTPNESVADVLVRVTQLISILETQYSGDTVVIISPDSDNLSVLQAALTGLDLKKHSSLKFESGEVRIVKLSPSAPPPPISGYVSFR